MGYELGLAALLFVLVPLCSAGLIVALAPWPLAVRIVLACVAFAIAIVLGLWLYVGVLVPWPAGD